MNGFNVIIVQTSFKRDLLSLSLNIQIFFYLLMDLIHRLTIVHVVDSENLWLAY